MLNPSLKVPDYVGVVQSADDSNLPFDPIIFFIVPSQLYFLDGIYVLIDFVPSFEDTTSATLSNLLKLFKISFISGSIMVLDLVLHKGRDWENIILNIQPIQLILEIVV